VDSSDDDEQGISEWSDLKPSSPDKHQDYVFLAHLLLAIIISGLSLFGGWTSWAAGTGLMMPVLLLLTGAYYGITIGINWYRDEFVPHIGRTRTIPEFESDGFLNYKRMNRRTILLSGYLSTAITQYFWSLIAYTVASFNPDFWSVFVLMLMLFGIMMVLFLFLLLIGLIVFERLWKSVYSDAAPIIEIDIEMNEYLQSLKESENESEET